mgnify:CR=1 FL=1
MNGTPIKDVHGIDYSMTVGLKAQSALANLLNDVIALIARNRTLESFPPLIFNLIVGWLFISVGLQCRRDLSPSEH